MLPMNPARTIEMPLAATSFKRLGIAAAWKSLVGLLLAFAAAVVSGQTPVPVAIGLNTPGALTLEGEYIYFGELAGATGSLSRVPKAGGVREIVQASTALVDNFGVFRSVDRIAFSSTDLFYGFGSYDSYRIEQTPRDGSQGTQVPPPIASISGGSFLGLVAGDLYYFEGFCCVKHLSPTPSATPQPIPGFLWPRSTANDASSLYFVDVHTRNVYRYDAMTGTPPVPLITNNAAEGVIFLDSNNIYLAMGNFVRKIPKAGGTVTDITLVNGARVRAVDDAFLYYTVGDQLWRKSPSITSVDQLIFSPVSVSDDVINPMVIDANYLYWSDTSSGFGAGAIFRLQKEPVSPKVSQARALSELISLLFVPATSGTTTALPTGYRIVTTANGETRTTQVDADANGDASVQIPAFGNGLDHTVQVFSLGLNQVANSTPATLHVTPQTVPQAATKIANAFPHPILLVHGFSSSANAWKTTQAALTPRYTVVAKSFADNTATPCAQIPELRLWINDAKQSSPMGKVVIIAHSQGGLVARALIQFSDDRNDKANKAAKALEPFMAGDYTVIVRDCQTLIADTAKFNFATQDIAALITYGTPHGGVDIDLAPKILQKKSSLLLPDSPFLQVLNDFDTFPVEPRNLPVTNLIGRNSRGSDSDCIVPVSSQKMSNFGFVSENFTATPVDGVRHYSGCFGHPFLTNEIEDATTILEALDATVLRIKAMSPVNIVVTDPAGRIVAKDRREIWGATYDEPIDDNGHTIDMVEIPYATGGIYQVQIIPDLGAPSDATFSLIYEIEGVQTVLAENMPVGDAQSGSFFVEVQTPNLRPYAVIGRSQTVRLGSVVTLDGSRSADPDSLPAQLSYTWSQISGPEAVLSSPSVAKPTFSPVTVGTLSFSLTVSDSAKASNPESVNIHVPSLGDIDLDGDIDQNDLNLVLAVRNQAANGPNDLRDLNGDLRIDALDARKVTTLCTRPRCATQ